MNQTNTSKATHHVNETTADMDEQSLEPDSSSQPMDGPIPRSHTLVPTQDTSSNGEKNKTSGFWLRLKRAFFGLGDAQTIREDLSIALRDTGSLDAAFSADERAMLDNILGLRDKRAADVMIPRADIEAVEQNITLGELLALFETSGHSRMPVFDDNLDDPRGMVHIRDLLAYLTRQARNGRRSSSSTKSASRRASTKPLDMARIKLDKPLKDINIIRDVLFVPESMLASDLLKRMQATRTQMALVIDEYGGTDGLVSLEDIVEIVVGDIEDEHDDDDGSMIEETGEGIWLADAKAPLQELNEILGSDFQIDEDETEYVDTLGGLIFAGLGRVPVRREVIRIIRGFEFHVVDADARRIKRVRIVRLKTSQRRRSSANSDAIKETALQQQTKT